MHDATVIVAPPAAHDPRTCSALEVVESLVAVALVLLWDGGHEGYALAPELGDVLADESAARDPRTCSPLDAVGPLVAAALVVLWAEGHEGYALPTELGDVLGERSAPPGPRSPGERMWTQLWWWSVPAELLQYPQQVRPKSVGLRQLGHS